MIIIKRAISFFTALILFFGCVSVFAEDFEDAEASLYKGFDVTSENSYKGEKSLEMTADVCYASFKAPGESKVAVCWFFDNISNRNINTNALVKAGDGIIGINGNISSENYVVKISDDDSWYITDIPRSGGWHQFVFDYSGTAASLYIDAKLVKNFKSKSEIDEL